MLQNQEETNADRILKKFIEVNSMKYITLKHLFVGLALNVFNKSNSEPTMSIFRCTVHYSKADNWLIKDSYAKSVTLQL